MSRWPCRCRLDTPTLSHDETVRRGWGTRLGCFRGPGFFGWYGFRLRRHRGCGRLRLLTQGVDDDAEHLFLRSRFAGPDFELACALLNEHLDAGNDGNALLPRHADERCIGWVVNQVEDDFRLQFVGREDLRAFIASHADRRRIDDDVEAGGIGLLVEGLALEDLGAGLFGELGRSLGGCG